MSFLTNLHTDLRRVRLTKRGSTDAPENVPRGKHKEYLRMRRIPLPEPAHLDITLPAALEKRSSSLEASGVEHISLEEIGTLLGHGLRRRDSSVNRNYPSGGALYPIETYLIAPSIKGLAGGIFHYHPTENALERLWDVPTDFSMKKLVGKPDFIVPTLLMVFTSAWTRSSAKYGDFTYTLALLEAGHMSENILLLAGAIGLEVRPMAAFNDNRIIELLDIDERDEQPVHTITFSKSSASHPSAGAGEHGIEE
ncbi:SagB/ThcOx family dehydrogenase [Candidatus Kaiserbacteria bacterium]|nr:SagB/ThcOx family dehydrogenase [Candidatus Kaiserbacteria bacterium]